MSSEKSDRPDPPVMPLEKLTQPAILLLLAQNRAHGYDLIQKLNQTDFTDGDLDTATVYRTLRRMEQEGLVTSRWEHGEFGPARRQYQLTEEGYNSLDQWAGALQARMRQIDSFLTYYHRFKRQAATDGSQE
jgi:poly-beta-hydroxybutyrate-responsive repressor